MTNHSPQHPLTALFLRYPKAAQAYAEKTNTQHGGIILDDSFTAELTTKLLAKQAKLEGHYPEYVESSLAASTLCFQGVPKTEDLKRIMMEYSLTTYLKVKDKIHQAAAIATHQAELESSIALTALNRK